MIASLLAQGRRVGITSNSHKAINHLLAGVMQVLDEQRLDVHGGQEGDARPARDRVRRPGRRREPVLQRRRVGLAARNWSPARPGCSPMRAADQQLDVLFVDEAGQVALANLVAAGTSARNIVLLGDQMQLASRSRACTRAARATRRWTGCSTARRRSRRTAASSWRPRWRMHPAGVPLHLRCGLRRPAGSPSRTTRGRPGARRGRASAAAAGGHRARAARARGLLAAQRGRRPRWCARSTPARCEQRYTDRDGVEHAMTAAQHPRRRAVQHAGQPAHSGCRPARASAPSTSSRARKPSWSSSR